MKIRNYSRGLFCSLVLLAFVSSLMAAPVQGKRLVNMGIKAFQLKGQSLGIKSLDSEPLNCDFVVDQQDTLLMVMNFHKGFIIMSADDAVTPVLAYSPHQQFDMNDIAPGAKMLLDGYKRQIRQVRRNATSSSLAIHNSWLELENNRTPKDSEEGGVAPLTTALWNQTQYYNYYSPIDFDAPSGYDNRTPNGCVAVAMATIMYYYRYPLHGSGAHVNHTDYGSFFVNFANHNYCYEAMNDQIRYYNNEVAKLIFHCATSVDMMYGSDGSGAYSENVPFALKTFFGYDEGCEYIHKHDYPISEWYEILMGELDASRPVYYSGYDEEGGHAFVCDGYDNDTLFHFNFGWGGSSNGYYVLINNDSVTNAVNGYNHGQSAVVGIYPKAAHYPYYCSEKVLDSQNGSLEDGSGPENYQNNSSCTYVITATNAYRVKVNLTYFDTQADHDSLSFWDGHPSQGHLLRTISGSMPDITNYSFGTDSLYITFSSDNSITAAGWRLCYDVMTHSYSCGSYNVHAYHGVLDDGSEGGNYKANASCLWHFRLLEASYIHLQFNRFDLKDGDFLEIYDWSTPTKSLITTLSGSSIPTPLTLNCNDISVEFKSDNYMSGDGFEIEWSSDYSPEAIEDFATSNVQVFPNPATTAVTIRLPEDCQGCHAMLYDVTGRLVQSSSTTGEAMYMDIHALPNGFYTIVVQGDNVSCKKKIIIQH